MVTVTGLVVVEDVAELVVVSLVGDQPKGGLVAIVLDCAASPHARKLTPCKYSKKFAS